MRHAYNGDDIFISTGGRAFDNTGEVLVFIHGSGQSHLTFLQQGRFFANRGWQVLNPDMPAHGLSNGAALTSIEEMADWYAGLIASLDVSSVILVGHSQGCLISLEIANRHPELVSKICFIAGALAIPVNDALLDMAENKPEKAYQAMVNWAHAASSHLYDHSWPGHTHIDFGNAVMAQNEASALFADLQACNNYKNGEVAAQNITCPTMAILAEKDRMTPSKTGLLMAQNLSDCTAEVLADKGHFLPSEAPFEVNKRLRSFIS